MFFAFQDLDRELEEICDKRRRLDDDNEARKKEIENLSVTFVKARAKNDRLKAEHNAVLANQIFLTARSDQILRNLILFILLSSSYTCKTWFYLFCS